MTRPRWDDDLEAAWAAFARQDADITAPSALEARVRLAAAGRRTQVTPRPAAAPADGPALPARPASARQEVRQAAVARRASAPAVPSVAGAAVGDGPWQVVRVRIDAAALGGLGVHVLGSLPAGLVDVDLVVGGDGWPHATRRDPQHSVGPAGDVSSARRPRVDAPRASHGRHGGAPPQRAGRRPVRRRRC